MVRQECEGGGGGKHRSARSFIEFHGADGAGMRREEAANIVPRGLVIKFHGADGADTRMGGGW